MTVPVLLNTANETFTVCTKWLGPTAPFVSGGGYWTVKPARPWPMRSKDEDTAGAAVLTVDCTAVSGEPATTRGNPWRGLSFLSLSGSSVFGGIAASRGEISFLEDGMTVTSSLSFAIAGPESGSVSASASRMIVPALSIALSPHHAKARRVRRSSVWPPGRPVSMRRLDCLVGETRARRALVSLSSQVGPPPDRPRDRRTRPPGRRAEVPRPTQWISPESPTLGVGRTANIAAE